MPYLSFLRLLLGVSLVGLTQAALGIPPGSSTVTVKVMNSVNPAHVKAPAAAAVFPAVPGKENLDADFYAFLIENTAKQTRVCFDIGIRKDPQNFVPVLAELFTSGEYVIPVDKDIPTQLTEGGVTLASIKSVIWSHADFDHIGDMSLWPNTTEIVFGEATDTRTYPSTPSSLLLESDFRGHNNRRIVFSNSTLKIGGFSAVDYFGDGSLYLLDVPGHFLGHMAALARVTSTTFILLSADTFHQAGQIRPSPHLHETFPVPSDILTSSRRTIARKFFFAPDDATDLGTHTVPFLNVPTGAESFYVDPVDARISQFMVGVFDADPNVFVISSHDPSMATIIDFFPSTLNDWKSKGWKTRGVWNFANVNARGYRLS